MVTGPLDSILDGAGELVGNVGELTLDLLQALGL